VLAKVLASTDTVQTYRNRSIADLKKNQKPAAKCSDKLTLAQKAD
jgi:hypothetical protein